MIQISKIYAQSAIQNTISTQLEKLGEQGDFASVVNSILEIVYPLSVFCAGLLLAFAAFKMISSKGDPEALKDAREQIGNAVTGLLFILLSGALLVVISKIIIVK